MGKRIEVLNGRKFGRLEIISEEPIRFLPCGQRQRIFLCKCECGKVTKVRLLSLICGNTKSCGCGKGKWRHGLYNSPEYRTWQQMKSRCLNRKDKVYKDYGERGITIDRAWLDFEIFLRDMGKRPEKTSLDRIDNDKGYYKENCRWATSVQQSNNTRSNVRISYDGKIQTKAEWARSWGLCYETFCGRLRRGWTMDRIFSQSNHGEART